MRITALTNFPVIWLFSNLLVDGECIFITGFFDSARITFRSRYSSFQYFFTQLPRNHPYTPKPTLDSPERPSSKSRWSAKTFFTRALGMVRQNF